MGKFRIGEVVVLNSNHKPLMTIEKENHDGTYTCIWQDIKGHHQNYDYLEAVLRKYINPAGVTRLVNRY